jgi:hypothetical protein
MLLASLKSYEQSCAIQHLLGGTVYELKISLGIGN